MRIGDWIDQLRRDRFVYASYVAYTLMVSLLAIYLGEPQKALRGIYLVQWIQIPVLSAIGYTIFVGYRSLTSDHAGRAFARQMAVFCSPRVVCGFITYMALGLFHGSFTAAKTLMEDLVPFAWDPVLADLDAALHGGDAWQLIPLLEPLTRAIQWLYYPTWLLMLAGVSFYVSIWAPDELRRRYFLTFFFCWVVLGNLVALAFLSGGPVYFQSLTGSARFGPLTEYLAFSRGLPWSSVDVSERLWGVHLIGDSAEGSGISAFPSLHLAMATLWLLTLRQIWSWMHWPLVIYVGVTQFGSIHRGWD
jgi:hypothetical protein